MENIKKIREEIINRELITNVETKTMLEFELALQKEQDPNEDAISVPLRMSDDGKRVLSSKTIKRVEYIEQVEEKLKKVNLRIKVLQEL